jgi:hypothetical protein
LTNLTLPFKNVSKDRLFYDQYRFSFGFVLPEVSCIRELNHDRIDDIVERRRSWRDAARLRWNTFNQSYGAKGWKYRHKPITDEMVDNLHNFAQQLLTTDHDYKLVTSTSTGYVYTNGVELIEQLAKLEYLKQKRYQQAVTNRPKNTISLKNPKHQYRSYFKSIKLPSEQKDFLIQFFENQKGYSRPSPSLVEWFEMPYHRTQDYFFVDHDSVAWLTMLSLVQPGLIRKTMQIITAK